MIVSKGEPLSRLLASPVATQSPLKEDGNKHVENLDNTVSSIQADDEEVTGYQGSEPSLGIQWPCGWATLNSQTASVADTSSSVALGWSSSKPRETSVARPLTAEEQIRCAALQLQKKVVEACQEFFVNAAGSESDADDDGDDGEDSLMDEDTFEECDEFNFFLRVFTENGELRNYYENNHEGGEFYCLVCGGIGKKAWKTFKGSAGLLQHSTTVLKTKKRRAHRAFGQVLCKVFGWGIDKHPINVSRGETLGSSLVRLSEVQQKPLRKLV
ncbi:hypothetical protein CFOL_v3_04245 [Cephalotus follicularis]|uniref:Uncharacterized protein n=1 Tax=Cephalotus follicularis TaxID=3775 RepID=A0A1Q3AY83_CEPFO|nr:hypothetical protein CFOL_v3_04245 [Cephalotus follicularis]